MKQMTFMYVEELGSIEVSDRKKTKQTERKKRSGRIWINTQNGRNNKRKIIERKTVVDRYLIGNTKLRDTWNGE